jgi:hypothetical protein
MRRWGRPSMPAPATATGTAQWLVEICMEPGFPGSSQLSSSKWWICVCRAVGCGAGWGDLRVGGARDTGSGTRRGRRRHGGGGGGGGGGGFGQPPGRAAPRPPPAGPPPPPPLAFFHCHGCRRSHGSGGRPWRLLMGSRQPPIPTRTFSSPAHPAPSHPCNPFPPV